MNIEALVDLIARRVAYEIRTGKRASGLRRQENRIKRALRHK